VTFDQHVYTHDAGGLAFNASTVAEEAWSPAQVQWRAMLWCMVRTLTSPQHSTTVPFSALFFRDRRSAEGSSGSGGSAAAQRHAGRSTRILFSTRDLPLSPASSTVLRLALEAAEEVLGEDVAGVWAAALQAHLQEQEGGQQGEAAGAAPRSSPLPLHVAPYADAALGALRSAAPLSTLAEFLRHGRRTRVCARRAVLPGNRDVAVGGLSEANFLREFAHSLRESAAAGSAPLEPVLHGREGKELPSAYHSSPAAAAAEAAASAPGALPRDGFIGRMGTLPILVLDRGQRENGFSVVGPWGRRFANRPGLLAVLDKYSLNYTLVEDVDLLRLSFEEQVALFNRHKVFIAAHGAGIMNSLFLPPRSAVIEVTPRGMFCPLFHRLHVAAGHFTFPIHSLLFDALQTFSYSSGHQGPWQEGYNESAAWHVARCVARGHFWSAVTEALCFHEAKTVPVVVPLHEFEAQLLHALDAVGGPLAHRGAAHHLLEGIPSQAELQRSAERSEAPFPWARDKAYYEKRAWRLVPPGGGGAKQ
jgi:hypothetical protein